MSKSCNGMILCLVAGLVCTQPSLAKSNGWSKVDELIKDPKATAASDFQKIRTAVTESGVLNKFSNIRVAFDPAQPKKTGRLVTVKITSTDSPAKDLTLSLKLLKLAKCVFDNCSPAFDRCIIDWNAGTTHVVSQSIPRAKITAIDKGADPVKVAKRLLAGIQFDSVQAPSSDSAQKPNSESVPTTAAPVTTVSPSAPTISSQSAQAPTPAPDLRTNGFVCHDVSKGVAVAIELARNHKYMRLNEPLYTGDLFNLRIRAFRKGYLWAKAVNKSGTETLLYPSRSEQNTISAASIFSLTDRGYIAVDAEPGTEKLYVCITDENKEPDVSQMLLIRLEHKGAHRQDYPADMLSQPGVDELLAMISKEP